MPDTLPHGFAVVRGTRPPWEVSTQVDLPALRDEGSEPTITIPAWGRRERFRIVALVPAHNEEEDIANTIRSLLDQTRQPDLIVIISDNSTDRTVEIARQFPVTVMETVGNTHRKSGALNAAWHAYCQDADIIVCADGDTMLPPHAVADWEAEFAADDTLGGSSSQPIMTGGETWNMRPARPWSTDWIKAFAEAVQEWYLPRLQRFEFAKGIAQSLTRGWVLVVSGTGCAYRNNALREVAKQYMLTPQGGPWTYESVVEDYHLTYQLRYAGWLCWMSPTVWCFTGSMKTLKSLWYQRIKWCGGTDGDLLKFGCDRLNYRQWLQNVFLLINIAFLVLWLALEVPEMAAQGFHMNWWWQGFAASFGIVDLIHMARLNAPRWRRDWKDWLLAGLLIHMYVYNVLSMAWGIASWKKALYDRTMGDLWAPQYRAEGMVAEEQKVGV